MKILVRILNKVLRLRGGIIGQISTLGWAVALLTLIIFVAGIIPEQKKDLEDALLSKARGISSSLREVTAGAAVSEDYSSVVDQCTQVLAGDEAIDYLVITKNDGFSVIAERNGWRTAELNSFWHPADRKPSGHILRVPDFGRRVYHFSRPFDYSAIQWGWIHVGLSLRAYDQSVRRVYLRTGALTVICVFLSLLISVTYAKRQVRPLLRLKTAVRQVAEGDLSARALIDSNDEIAALAQSFNLMTESILQRNEILESVRFAAQELLFTSDVSTAISEILGRIGMAAQASHVWVCERCSHTGGVTDAIRYEWTSGSPSAEGVARHDLCRWHGDGAGSCVHTPEDGSLVQLELISGEKRPFSQYVVPISDNGAHAGFLGVDDCAAQRQWSNAEQDCFRAVAGMIGAAFTRHRVLQALHEAKDELERRVDERTRELQEQVYAKDRAHKELAEAQQNLIQLSRQSGMAEVATSVLHNVGNVLNSVNVSATIIADKARDLRVENLGAALNLIEQNQAGLTEYLHSDPKGQRILPYLGKLVSHLQGERQMLVSEAAQLRDHIEHIKGIVSTQQSYAKVSGLVEDIHLPDLLADACRILQTGFERHNILLEREVENVPAIPADKHAVMQILLNLIRNAKDAVKAGPGPERRIKIRVSPQSGNVRVEVMDSGVGIAPENLTRIFSHGFTTKANGHGFGLHSSALDARKMGGSLMATSAGPGQGATFILELPQRALAKGHAS